MAGRSVPDRWKVAFSLAGENRELVGAIASDVERQLGESTVFYDEWFEFLIAGEDADIALQRIYGKRSDLVVGCISGAYDVKPWTRIERRAIRAIDWEESAFNGVKRVLWVRVGPGEVEGILPNAIVPDFTQKSVSDAAQLIIDRLGLVLDSVGVRDTSGRDRPDAEGAIGDFDEAVRLEPANAVAYTNRGTARRDMGDVEGAIEDFGEAIRLEPGNAFAYTNRGTARRHTGDLEGAIEDFGEAIRLEPGNVFAYTNRGTARRDMGDVEGAIGDFDEAIRLEPGNVFAYTNRGTARRDMGDVEGAIEDFGEAIRLEPGNVFAYTNRGTARRDMGDVEGAIEDFDEASRLDPGFGGRSDDGGS